MPTRSHGKPAIFLHDFVDVGCPAGVARTRLGADGTWLSGVADAAAGEGETLLVRLGSVNGSHHPTIGIRVRLGEGASRGEAWVVPIRWEAARLSPLFPVLDGDLEVAPLGADECRLLLQATYRPPLDGVGRLLDAALLHRVAESTVRSFLLRLADGIAGSADQTGTA